MVTIIRGWPGPYPGARIRALDGLRLGSTSTRSRRSCGWGTRRTTWTSRERCQAIFEIRQRHRDRNDLLLLFASYWDHAKPNARSDLVQSEMGHACEWETSMMLRLAPHLVKDHARHGPVGFGFGFAPAYRGWTTRDRTVTGHIGHPQAATAEKGEYLFATYAAGVGKLLEEVIAWDGKSWEMP